MLARPVEIRGGRLLQLAAWQQPQRNKRVRRGCCWFGVMRNPGNRARDRSIALSNKAKAKMPTSFALHIGEDSTAQDG